MIRLFFFSTFFVTTILYSDTPSVETIKENVISQFARIEDYKVDIRISVNMTGFRMPRKKIRMYFKKPDMVKVETRGFAVLPKMGSDGNPNEFLDMLSHVTDIQNMTKEGHPFIKISGEVNKDSLGIPVEIRHDKIPEISMDVFVDAENWVITEVGVYLDSESVFTFATKYMDVNDILVPKESVFRIGIKGISRWSTQNPFDFGGPGSDRKDFESIAKNAGFDAERDEFVGELKMLFSKYKINQGLDDELFE